MGCGFEINWDAVGAGAAIAQALMSAAAVVWAARLQDQSIKKQDEARHRERVENAAFVARWSLSQYELMVGRLSGQSLTISQFRNVDDPDLTSGPLDLLKGLDLAELRDNQLIVALLDLRRQISGADKKLEAERALAADSGSLRLLVTLDFGDGHRTRTFNAAASAERRAAELNKRKPLL